MAGQIIQRGENVFLVRVFLGRDKDGKRRYHNKTIHGTKKDAQRYLTAVLRERDLGTFAEPTRMTLDEYLDKWLEAAVKPRVQTRTYDDHEAILKRYVREPLGLKKLHQITSIEIQNLYSSMMQKGLSPRTVRYLHAVLHDALDQAVTWGLIPKNPAARKLVDLPRQERREMQAMSPEQAKRFLQAAKKDPWYPLFLLALTTGMRPEEYLALQWKDISFETATASVCRALIRRGKGWRFEEPKTARSRRSVKLSPTLVQALQAHKKRQAAQRLKAGATYQNLDLVFAGEGGLPLHASNLTRRHFKPILEKAGLPSTFRLYDPRHTCATLLLAAGENPKVVSELLGHSTVRLTLDTYSHVLPDMQKGAVEKMEAMLFS